MTGAITAVKSEELVKTTTPTTAGALVGKAPGISARQADGRPGASASIQIRNMGTPLYVIDGIQCEEGQFNNIDVNDIESITVLKDASAAIYGLRAANGVVLVTTKSGKEMRRVLFLPTSIMVCRTSCVIRKWQMPLLSMKDVCRLT